MRFFLIYIVLILCTISVAQDKKTPCLECHNDQSLVLERDGEEISLFIDKQKFENSVHAQLECVDCHSGFDADNLPHKEGSNISTVDCASCHDTEEFSKSVHGQKNVQCFSCHTKHDIQLSTSLKTSEAAICISCHNTPSVKNYSKSVHFKNFLAGKKAPICTDCHDKTAHNIKSVGFSKKDEQKLCAECHKGSKDEFSLSVHNLAKDPHTPGCVSCHGAHEVYNNKYSISSQACLKCHLDKKSFEKAGKSNLVEFVRNYQTSIHARVSEKGGEAATCVDCHANHMILGVSEANSKIAKENIPNTCGKCHNNVLNDYKKSSHGIAFISNITVAPNCIDCHGEHNIGSIEKSPLNKLNEHKVCFECHTKNAEVIKLAGIGSKEILDYETSVHFQALKNGNENSATCSDCHGAHLMQTKNVQSSRVRKENVAQTCGNAKGCHNDIAKEYMESIHADAVNKGIMDAPTCTDCHGNHQIKDKKNPTSKIATGKNVVLLCSSCHADVEMISKYGVSSTKTTSYNESYHGLAVRGGSKYSADCASCHGAHNIKPSSDPTSSINDKNLSVTCGKCHPGANITDEFKKVHLTGSKDESLLLYWLTRIYIALIILIIGFMLIHNILDFVRKRQEIKKHKKEIKELKEQGKYYLRMTFNERVQHFTMLTSFIALVFTGFALKYPEAWWVLPFRYALGEWAFETRSIAHRIFGIAMIIVSLYHSYYLLFTKRGRQLLFDLLPNLKDLRDFIINVKYLFGINKTKPLFNRFSYMEKAEYWALVWGVVIMSATGLILFFNSFFLSFAPKILMDATTLIHLYEAWLATLAIVVWHFYFVIFNPEVYPLNTAFITGVLSEEEMKHEHPLELENILQAKKDADELKSDDENIDNKEENLNSKEPDPK